MGGRCSKVEQKYRKMDHAEVFAGKVSEYEDSTNFQEINIGKDFNVLVAKIAGKFHCIGSRCPHAGGPLGEGFYDDGRIYCPWHGSCFDFETGDIEEFPGLDCVPKYPVSTRGGKVYVYINTNNIQMQITKPMSKLSDYSTRMAIVGGGAAGYMCTQTLRQEGYTGIITMFTDEPYLPYDWTKLSKELGCKWSHIKLRGKDFYLENDIEVRLNTSIERINFFEHKIYAKGSTSYFLYDALFIAIGNRPSQSLDPARGFNLKNITTLHSLEDAKFLPSNVQGRKLLIVGSSFLAMELVTMLRDECQSIDILSRQKSPYRTILGAEVVSILLRYLKSIAGEKRITFHESNDVKYFKGNGSGEVASCVTVKKQVIKCDFVILANGVRPNTKQFEGSKLALDKITGAIVVNKYLETNIKHTFAGGDCCRFPLSCAAKNSAVVEHWQVALTHGRVAALNMLNDEQKISISDIVPFYWTVCGDIVIKYCGHGESYNEILIFGSTAEQEQDAPEFCAIYRRGTKIVAACAANCDSLIVEISVALQSQSEWTSEFPECLTQRFPDEPTKVVSNFGIRPDFEHDLIKSDLEIAFIDAMAHVRVEALPEPFVPLKSTLLDMSDEVDTRAKDTSAQTEEDRNETLRKKRKDFETNEITLGLHTKLPITEFGEDEGIPILPQTTYVPTKEYLTAVDKKWTPALGRASSGTETPRSKQKLRIDSVPRFLKSEPGRVAPPVKIVITDTSEPETADSTQKGTPASNLLELPKQHVKANRRLSPTAGIARRASSYGAVATMDAVGRQESPRTITKEKSQETTQVQGEPEKQKRRGSFRSELAGITGKLNFNSRTVRSVPSLTSLQAATEAVPAAQRASKVGVITEFPKREPIVDPFLESGTPKKILIPKTLRPSVENELNLDVPTFLKSAAAKKSMSLRSVHTGMAASAAANEEGEYLHEKPNYKRLVTKDTSQIAKLVIKQFPEITRARAHLSGNKAPILEEYPPNTTMTPLLTKTPSEVQKEVEKHGQQPHSHGISVNNRKITFTKRVNYDFEK